MAEADPKIDAQTQANHMATHVDVLVVGAGISGLGAAYHLARQCPEKTYLVLESKSTFGGTWETHKFPGVRSDSDLFTFGFRDKPWVAAPIADADKILRYLGEMIDDSGIGANIRYQHLITACSWSSEDTLWHVAATNTQDNSQHHFTCNFLWMCQGYYNHNDPHIPDWPGRDRFKGMFVHAQQWDPATDYSGKRIVVIGSGATAATIVPAMAAEAAHVTMLQRTPTWFFPAPNENELATALRAGGVDAETVHKMVRIKVNYDQDVITKRCVNEPEAVKQELLAAAQLYLGPDADLTPFTPDYRPWQQRVAYIPDGDLYVAVGQKKASVVTAEIDQFTENGITLTNGETLDADIIIAATGFDLSVMGGIPFSIDGAPLDWAKTVTYRGMMFTGVPNMIWVFGYFRYSWTLRVELLADFVCRLLKHMDAKGKNRVDVALRPEDQSMPLNPFVAEDNFNPGYIKRGLHLMPKSGDKPEWMHNQDYWLEKDVLPAIDLDGAEFSYG
jgi:monooxygenase